MVNNDIVRYIKQQNESGLTKEQIIGSLKQSGWNDADITAAFDAVSSRPNQVLTREKPRWFKYLIITIIAVLIAGAGTILVKLNNKNNTGSSAVKTFTPESSELKTFGDVTVGSSGEYIIGQNQLSGIEKEITISENLATFSYKYKFEGNGSQDLVFINPHGKEYNEFYKSEYEVEDGFRQQVVDLYDYLLFAAQCEEFKDLCEPPFKMKVVIRSAHRTQVNNPGKLIIKDIQFTSAYDGLAEEIIRNDFLYRKKALPLEACDILLTPSLRKECKERAPRQTVAAFSSKGETTNSILAFCTEHADEFYSGKERCVTEKLEELKDFKDMSLCNQLTSKLEKEKCAAEIGRRLAVVELSVDKCSDAGWLKNECIADVGIGKIDFGICEKIDNEVLRGSPNPKMRCYFGVATKKGDPQFCQEIRKIPIVIDFNRVEIEDYENRCKEKYAASTGNVSICEDIKMEPNMISLDKDKCYFSVASEGDNPDLCNKVGNNVLKNYCIASIPR